jgi:AcrR family transcriptional regulator
MSREPSTSYRPEQTRRELLEAAFEEIWKSGFRAASLEAILAQAGVTKGALYHHFKNKRQMGYAVVDEVLRERVKEQWIDPLLGAEDPILALQQLPRLHGSAPPEKSLTQGCPVNNLAQEMSGIDEGFRERIQAVLMEWRDGIASALRNGQARGQVRENIRPEHAAMFILSVFEGAAGLAKSAQDEAVCQPCFEGLHYYLEALRPRRGFRS